MKARRKPCDAADEFFTATPASMDSPPVFAHAQAYAQAHAGSLPPSPSLSPWTATAPAAAERESWRFRELTPEDDAALAALIRQVLREFGLNREGFAFMDPELDHLSTVYRQPGCAYTVVEMGQHPASPDASSGTSLDATPCPAPMLVGGAGFAPLAGGPGGICELQKLYLHPVARGRGVGRRLLRQILAGARGAGYRYAYLESESSLAAAQTLFQQEGFQPLPGPLGATGHGGCNRWYVLELESWWQLTPFL